MDLIFIHLQICPICESLDTDAYGIIEAEFHANSIYQHEQFCYLVLDPYALW